MFCALETAMRKSTTIFVLWSISPFMTIVFNSVQFSSVTQSYPTLFDPMDHNMPGSMAINICFVYWGALILGNINIYSCCIFLDWSLDHCLVLFLVYYNCLYLIFFFMRWALLLLLSFNFHLHGISFSSLHFQSVYVLRSDVGFL